LKEYVIEASIFIFAFIIEITLIIFIFARIYYLESFTRLCAWCRRVYYNGKWIQIEKNFQKTTNAKMTHEICNDCAEKLKNT
jgi:hypothetical protein